LQITVSYGITQDPKTKNYIMVLGNKCKNCNSILCIAKHFQQNFNNWTSGNNDIDKLIQGTQLSTHYSEYGEIFKKVLEWIPYNRLHNIEYIARGGFGKVYKANWIDGCIDKWDNKKQNWKRNGINKLVALKSLNNSRNVTFEFMNEV
jgi:hypothetical protein